jgi:hypothetical protein
MDSQKVVTPAKAGVQRSRNQWGIWIPASAGRTIKSLPQTFCEFIMVGRDKNPVAVDGNDSQI